jgi:hypothetical protein
MSHVKAYLAYSWAFLAAPLVLATFMGMNVFSHRLVAGTGLHVHPLYTGGEVAQTIDHGRYRTLIHRPVFDGLVGPREHGFVQIQWQPKDTNLPAKIDEQIDFDADGTNDFRIRLDTVTQETGIEPHDGRVLAVEEVVAVPDGRIVRVGLRRTPR